MFSGGLIGAIFRVRLRVDSGAQLCCKFRAKVGNSTLDLPHEPMKFVISRWPSLLILVRARVGALATMSVWWDLLLLWLALLDREIEKDAGYQHNHTP